MGQPVDSFSEALQRARDRRRLPAPSRRRLLRESVGISQSAIAREIGVPPSVVCRWESGERAPGGHHLAKYLAVLDRLAREATQ